MSTQMCYNRRIPREYLEEADEVALRENELNGNQVGREAVGMTKKFWKPGRKLRVRFLDGEPDVIEKVMHYAKQWTEHANIDIVHDQNLSSEIRVSFLQPGSWSAIGTDAMMGLIYPKDKPTVNFGWLTPETPDEEVSRVVLHEFGHVLGLVHEHSHPNGEIPWKEDVVVASLSGPPNKWSIEEIQHNVFYRYEAEDTQFAEFDPESIMLYFFPQEWLKDGGEMRKNNVLSATDKAFIAERYPR